jgi:DNA-binding SARP family transcriptional activator
MPRISMNTLGVCSIVVDGVVQPTVPSGCFRIATYLLLSGSRMTMSRQHLKSVFWPEADLEKASANLRQNLVRIRRFQDEHGFQLIGSSFTLVYLMPHEIDWDLPELLEALEGDDEASIVSACELYGGDLLADIGASSPEFEEWLYDQRERLRGTLIEKLVGALCDVSLSAAARGLCAHRLLAIDPCNEQAYQRLMTEAAEQGDHARLHNLFERCERQLMNEFGVGSSAGTRGLYSELARNLPSLPPRNDSS